MVRPPRAIQEMPARVAAVEGLLSQRVGHDATARVPDPFDRFAAAGRSMNLQALMAL